jgi:hypothetical protein
MDDGKGRRRRCTQGGLCIAGSATVEGSEVLTNRNPTVCWKRWDNNALRHSFGSNRLPIVKSYAQVALEMGNSPAKVEMPRTSQNLAIFKPSYGENPYERPITRAISARFNTYQITPKRHCARWDSNPQPRDYESPALTIELQARRTLVTRLPAGRKPDRQVAQLTWIDARSSSRRACRSTW